MDEDLEEEDEDGEDVGAGPGGSGEKFVRVLLRLPFVSMFLLPSLEAFLVGYQQGSKYLGQDSKNHYLELAHSYPIDSKP